MQDGLLPPLATFDPLDNFYCILWNQHFKGIKIVRFSGKNVSNKVQKDLGERPLLSSSIPSSTPLSMTEPVISLFPGSGSCRFSYADPSITVSYSLSASTNGSDDWVTMEKLRSLPSNSPQSLHLLQSPPSLLTIPLQHIFLSHLSQHHMKIYCSV